MASAFRRPAIRQPLQASGNVKLEGLTAYYRKLGELGADVFDRGLTTSLAAGSAVMRDAARQYAPVLKQPDARRKPGTLRQAIVRMHSSISRFTMSFVIGVRLLRGHAVSSWKRRTGLKSTANPDDPFYGPILEFGKTARTRHQFLRPAFSASAERAVRVAYETLAGYTDSAIRRLGAQR